MPIRIGVVMNPIEHIRPKTDTSLGLMLAAQQKGWELHYFTPEAIYWHDQQCHGHSKLLSVSDHPQKWYHIHDEKNIPLSELDVMLIRVDPPFDARYLQLTLLLEHAKKQGLQVINDPRSLRDANEKFFALEFADCCPPTLISANHADILSFMKQHQKVVIKPMDQGGGHGIYLLHEKDPNHKSLLATATNNGTQWIVVQQYLPAIEKGDKRILMVHGEPIAQGLKRIPAADDLRGNLAAGGRAQGAELTEREQWICAQVGPTLQKMGLNFVGLDVIGDYLTEINVTSPTCMRQLDAMYNLNIADQLFDPLSFPNT